MAISEEIGNTLYYKYVVRVLVFIHQVVKSILITESQGHNLRFTSPFSMIKTFFK